MDLQKLGSCYELGYEFQQKNPEYTLVHGYLTNSSYPYQTIDHCWCMIDNFVYDAVMEEFFNWDIYKKIYGAEIERQYNVVESTDMAAKTGRYGGWYEMKIFDSDKYYDSDGALNKEYVNYKEDYENYLKKCEMSGEEHLNFEHYKEYFDKQIEVNIKNFRVE